VQHSVGRCLLDGQHIQAGDVVDVHDGPVVSAIADRAGDTVLSGSFDKQPDDSAAVPVDPAGADDDRAHLAPGRRQDRLFENGTPSAEGYRIGRGVFIGHDPAGIAQNGQAAGIHEGLAGARQRPQE
jgi:hypothetical protein